MKLHKEKGKKVTVQVKDLDTKKSKSITVYDTTKEEVINLIKKTIKDEK